MRNEVQKLREALAKENAKLGEAFTDDELRSMLQEAAEEICAECTDAERLRYASATARNVAGELELI